MSKELNLFFSISLYRKKKLNHKMIVGASKAIVKLLVTHFSARRKEAVVTGPKSPVYILKLND